MTFNFVNNNLRYFLKLFRDFLKIVYFWWKTFISSEITFQSNWQIITLYFQRTVTWINQGWQSSKNIYQVIDLVQFINAYLEKVIIYNLPECFTVFCSIFLGIVYCVFDKFLEYVTLLFCSLIVQRDLIILFIFGAG